MHKGRNHPIVSDANYWDSIAESYHEKVISPLLPEVENPIWDYVDKLDKTLYQVVGDFGCGIGGPNGRFLDFLCSQFLEVWGIDFSEKMLEIVRQRCQAGNLKLAKLDLRNLQPVYDYFDVAFSINSVVPSGPEEVPMILMEIYKALHARGLLVAILPSFDTVVHLRDLTYQDYLKKGLSDREALRRIQVEFDRGKYMDVERGLYADDGKHIQKFFFEHEVNDFLGSAGFSITRMEKVRYPWEISQRYGYGYYPNEAEIYDWFVVAEKIVNEGPRREK